MDKYNDVADLLIENRDSYEGNFWEWLSELDGNQADKKTANKFFLGCIIDYQMKAETVWSKVRKFSEEKLRDPDNLWDVITDYSYDDWMSRFREFSLHRFPKAHERVWRIGNIIKKDFSGDVRNIWLNKTPAQVYKTLIEMKMGKQISNMCIGALLDTNQIEGTGDVKADINVKRVIGRVFKGDGVTEKETIEITRKMYPENPWLLDRELYLIGKDFCYADDPECDDCYLEQFCSYCNMDN